MEKSIAVLTSGGDAPGMNAAIRAVVRVGLAEGFFTTVYGVMRGLEGLINDDFVPLTLRSVSNIIQRGGTIIRTARSEAFMTPEGRQKAADNLVKRGVTGLVGIGGDGTFHGLVELGKIWSGQIIGVPGTIDNDLYGSDLTIGFETAVNTALDAIDRLRDTADSHDRFFLVEVMGRWAGYLALQVAIAGGAEHVILPEFDSGVEEIARSLEAGRAQGKQSGIVIVSERGKEGAVYEIAQALEKSGHCKYRVTVLGHIQRGGSPCSRDRVLATKLGAYSIKALRDGMTGVMAGEMSGKLVCVPLEETWTRKKDKPLDDFLIQILPALAR
ncbi:MAG: ATP-dependent 6-phosphofructokinase [Phycisphaerae bacterium]